MMMNSRRKSRASSSIIGGNPDTEPVVLLIIDPQIDFHEGGSLAIEGAKKDSERVAAMIEQNLNKIDKIYVTLDSHHINHIAHQSFWQWGNPKGKAAKDDTRADIKAVTGEDAKKPSDDKIRPKVFSTILSSDIENGTWIPVDRSLKDYCIKYAKELETKGKFNLCIWPNHCLIGTIGHSVQPSIHNALQKWSKQRMRTVEYVRKGMNCLTEMYSVIEAEVPVVTDPGTTKNKKLLAELTQVKRLIVCGQALSHCVCWTVEDILAHWATSNVLFSRMFLLQDGTSSVAGYEAAGLKKTNDWKNRGVVISETTTVFDKV